MQEPPPISIEDLIDAADPRTEENISYIKRLNHLIVKNKKCLFDDTEEDKEIIFAHIDSKIRFIKQSENIIYSTGKNLLYFSIFLDEYFVEMLDICLRSIAKNTPNINFDILFITDNNTKRQIENLDSIRPFNCEYLILDVPPNGIEASFNKLNIIKFPRLNEYEKILYMDVDILAVKDINAIFELSLTPGILHVKSNVNKYFAKYFTTPVNGLMFLTRNMAQYILDNKDLLPMNAGQFIFTNCSYMQEHIKNVLWMSDVWPGVYFFEQSFMNSYFSLNGLTEQSLLSKLVSMISSPNVAYSETGAVTSQLSTPSSTKPKPKSNLLVVNALDSKFSKRKVDVFEKKIIKNTRDKQENIVFYENFNPLYTDLSKKHTDDTILIHFAGWSSNGRQKIHFTKTYCDAHQLPI